MIKIWCMMRSWWPFREHGLWPILQEPLAQSEPLKLADLLGCCLNCFDGKIEKLRWLLDADFSAVRAVIYLFSVVDKATSWNVMKSMSFRRNLLVSSIQKRLCSFCAPRSWHPHLSLKWKHKSMLSSEIPSLLPESAMCVFVLDASI